MDFLAPVQAQYDVVHFFIQEFIDFVVQQHAVRCESETESLPGLLFLTARIFDDLLHNAPSHQRLTAEEVDVQVTVESGILKQEIDCLLADFEFHDRPVAVVLALARETVIAGQVTRVRHVQAQSLHEGLAVLQVDGKVLVHVFREQFSVGL